MSKSFVINFDDSEEELYRWIAETPNVEKKIKDFIKDQLNSKSSKQSFTLEELNEIAKKARELFSDDKTKREVAINGEMKRYRK